MPTPLSSRPTATLRHWARVMFQQAAMVPEFEELAEEARLVQAELARRVTPSAIAEAMESDSGLRAVILI